MIGKKDICFTARCKGSIKNVGKVGSGAKQEFSLSQAGKIISARSFAVEMRECIDDWERVIPCMERMTIWYSFVGWTKSICLGKAVEELNERRSHCGHVGIV